MWYNTGTAKKPKPSKKPAKPQPKKPQTKKSAKPAKKKPAAAKPAGKKPAGAPKKGRGGALEPVPVSTGKGTSVAEIGGALVAMFNAGRLSEIENNFWAPEIVSCEGLACLEWRGRDAVDAKNHGWLDQNEIVGASAEGPYLGATGFAVKFRMQVRQKSGGPVISADEIGVYTVRDGKIVREEFMGN